MSLTISPTAAVQRLSRWGCAWAILTTTVALAADPAPVLNVDRGLVVVVASAEVDRALALAQAAPVLVHAVAADAAGEERLRSQFIAAGAHGQVTAGRLGADGRVALVDALASAVVADLDAHPTLSRDEALRILRPLGTAQLKVGGKWQVETKPRPREHDDWAQYYHDAAMTEVSQDTAAGPAQGLQWVSPRSQSTQGVCVIDDLVIRQEDGLVARDAFNGLPVWRRPDVVSVNRYSLVADRERLYVFNGRGQVSLNLRTGKTELEYTEGLDLVKMRPSPAELAANGDPKGYKWNDTVKDYEVRLSDGVLVQCGGPGLAALDAKTGKRLWLQSATAAKWSTPIVDQGVVYVVKGQNARNSSYVHWPMPQLQSVHAFDLRTGQERWSWVWAAEMPAFFAANPFPWEKSLDLPPPEQRDAVVMHATKIGDKLVYLLRAEMKSTLTGIGAIRQLVLDGTSGKRLAYGPTPGYRKDYPTGNNIGGGHSGARVFAAGGKLWFTSIVGVLGTADPSAPTDLDKWGKPYAGFDRPVGCTVFRATDRFLFGSLTTYSVDGSAVQHTNAARTICDIGAFPANGMSYLSSVGCHCQPYLPGSNTFHPRETRPADDSDRLDRGASGPAPVPAHSADSWPMFLRDNLRTSWTDSAVPANLAVAWTSSLTKPLAGSILGEDWDQQWYGQGPVTGLSVAEGIAIAALTDRQQIVALDPSNGKERWRTAVDGRVDSQPTIANGLVLAGTRNGWLYALNRDTGALVWRFRAAPRNERIVANGQLESPWPLFGTVTVDDEGVWAVAGRHSECDGGLWWWRLDPLTGKVLKNGRFGQNALNSKIEGSGDFDFSTTERHTGANSPLVTDGKIMLLPKLYARRVDGGLQLFEMHKPTTPLPPGRKTPPMNMRNYYEMINANETMVPGNYGLLSGDISYACEKKIGYGWVFARQVAYRKDEMVALGGTAGNVEFRMGDGTPSKISALRRLDQPEESPDKRTVLGAKQLWEFHSPLASRSNGRDETVAGVRALAVAGDVVLAGLYVNAQNQEAERKRLPNRLVVLNRGDGKEVQQLALPDKPIRGGISVAGGRVYVSTRDGSITCFAAASGTPQP
ncbi:hypothetical protein LBMAG53_17830 [Planctomycetota bacterium]|nr:hypothetical protein LBMAG53_17830 [Planctomycetota bacterium]